MDPVSHQPKEPDRVYLLAFPADFKGSGSSLASFTAILVARWRLLLAASLTGAVLFYASSFLVTSRYSSESLLVVAESDQSSGLLGSVLSGLGASSAISSLGIGMSENVKSEAMAYLRSREFARKTIEKYDLMPLLFRNERLGLARLFGDSDRAPEMQEGVRVFVDDVLRVSENRSAGTVSIGIVLPDRDRVAAVANGMIADLNEEMRARSVTEAASSLAFLQKEADAADSVEVRQTIFKLMEAQYRRRMLANVRRDFVFRVVDPAPTPDPRDRVSPRRPVWAITGFTLSLGLSCLWLLAQRTRQRARE
jgi:uncharacterized protein involved in exopolysaccharide biosynthesis